MASEKQHWHKLDLHSAELEAVGFILPFWLVRKAVNEKGENSNGLPITVLHCTANGKRQHYALIWHVQTRSKLERFVGYIEISSENEVICSSTAPDCAEVPDFLSSCTPIPFDWEKLFPDEFAFHSAELEITRSMLPSWLVRNAVDKKEEPTNGQPAEVLVCRASDSRKYYALIWYAQNGRQLERFIGYIETSPEKGLICPSSALECFFDMPHFLISCKPVPFGDYFWMGETQKLEENEKKEQVQTALNLQQKDQGAPIGEEPEELIMETIHEIQKGYDPELKDHAIKESERRWRRHMWPPLDPSKNEDLKQIQALRVCIEQKVVNFTFPEENVSISAVPLDFYEDYLLYRITDRRGLRSRTTHLVAKPSSDPDMPVCALGNTSAPINEFNGILSSRHKLNLTEDTAADYLVFFCRFVYGDAGAFQIIEDPEEDLDWISSQLEKVSREKKELVEKLLLPVQRLTPNRTENMPTEVSFHYSAFVGYGRDLFFARFQVKPNGEVEMDDDEPCFDNLAIIPLIFDEEAEFILQIKPHLPRILSEAE